jgi:outer membrane protein
MMRSSRKIRVPPARNGLAGVLALGMVLAPASGLAREAGEPSATPEESTRRVLTLEEVERHATGQQPQVLTARAATAAAVGQADQARSPLLPQLTLTASYLRETGNYVPRPGVVPSTITLAPSPSSRSFDFWSLGATLVQLLYDFGQTAQRYHSADALAEATRLSERTTLLQVLYGARRAYFNARAARELGLVARQTLDNQKKHLLQVQGFVAAGTQPQIALAQQTAAVANAEVQLITAENNYETAKAQLNQAAGFVANTEYDVADEVLPPIEGEDQPLELLVARADAWRPELAAVAKQVEAQDASLSSAKGAYGPSITANAAATEQGTALTGLVYNWQAGVAVSWPIFQGGLTQAQVHQAEAALASVSAQREAIVLQVRLDIDSARLAVRAAKATMSAAGDALASAREQLRLAEQRYATGVGSIIELNDAQVTYTGAAAQVVQARYGLASARAQLLAALGRT